VEVAVRWRTYAYVKNSYCRFLKSHLNKLDVFVVAVDIILAIVINVLMSRLNDMSADAASSEQYAPLVSGLRILRLFRLFRVVRAVRVLRKLVQEVQGTAEGYESHLELEDFEDPETITERVSASDPFIAPMWLFAFLILESCSPWKIRVTRDGRSGTVCQ